MRRRNATVGEQLGGFVIAGFVGAVVVLGPSAPSAAPAPMDAPSVAPRAPEPTAAPQGTPWIVVLPDGGGLAPGEVDCDDIEDRDAIEDPDVLDYCEGER